MNKVNESYLKWLEALNESRTLRMKLNNEIIKKINSKRKESIGFSEEVFHQSSINAVKIIEDNKNKAMRNENINSERLPNHAANICQHGGRGNTQQS